MLWSRQPRSHVMRVRASLRDRLHGRAVDAAPASGGEAAPAVQQSTATLLASLRQTGDPRLREQLFARYLPILRRWAHGRLPAAARDAVDTDDLVQICLLRALDRVEDFEPRREGAFLAYLRTALLNAIRDEIRRTTRRPRGVTLDEDRPGAEPSALEQAIGGEALERYENGLLALPEEQREAVILRIELGLSHQEVAAAVGCASPDAARMMVARALVRLADVMHG